MCLNYGTTRILMATMVRLPWAPPNHPFCASRSNVAPEQRRQQRDEMTICTFVGHVWRLEHEASRVLAVIEYLINMFAQTRPERVDEIRRDDSGYS